MPHTTMTALWSGVTSAQSAPTDASAPTADQATATSTGVRGCRFAIELDAIASAGAATYTVDLYLWSGTYWTKSSVSISGSSSVTASAPAGRVSYEVDDISPYKAICPVLAVIAGTNAAVTCRVAAK
jgi:hypothetical protein